MQIRNAFILCYAILYYIDICLKYRYNDLKVNAEQEMYITIIKLCCFLAITTQKQICKNILVLPKYLDAVSPAASTLKL